MLLPLVLNNKYNLTRTLIPHCIPLIVTAKAHILSSYKKYIYTILPINIYGKVLFKLGDNSLKSFDSVGDICWLTVVRDVGPPTVVFNPLMTIG